MLFFTCALNTKQENVIFVFIVTIIIILLLLLLLIITLHLSSSFATILSVFFLYSVYQKRIRLQMNKVLLGGRGEGDMLVWISKLVVLHFEVAVIIVFAVAVSTNLHVVCCHFFCLSRPCHLLEFYPIRPSLSTQKHDLTVPLLTKAENKNIVLLLPFMSLFNSCKPLTLIQNGKLFDTHVCCDMQ